MFIYSSVDMFYSQLCVSLLEIQISPVFMQSHSQLCFKISSICTNTYHVTSIEVTTWSSHNGACCCQICFWPFKYILDTKNNKDSQSVRSTMHPSSSFRLKLTMLYCKRRILESKILYLLVALRNTFLHEYSNSFSYSKQ